MYHFTNTNNPVDFPTMITKEQKIAAAQERARLRIIEKNELDRQRADLLKYAEKVGVGIVHIYDKTNPKGGMTVAYRKATQYKSGFMVEIAIATCSEQDCFAKKVGTLLALGKFADGETIFVPIRGLMHNSEGIAFNVKYAFESLYYAV